MLNRKSLKELAIIRQREAKILLDNNNFDGAYYLIGYVIELALKACIAKRTVRYEFPDKKTVENSYSHDLTLLFKTASLWPNFEIELKTNRDLEVNWSIVKDWSEKVDMKDIQSRKL